MGKQSVIKRKKNPGIIIPLVLAILVAFIFYTGAEKKTQSDLQPTQVPIAVVQLKEHTEIKEEHIKMITIPASGVPPIIIRNPNALIGKYVGTKYTIPQNGYFYADSISNFEDIPSRIPMMLGPNNLGITMRMNLEKSVANSLSDGQYVQVRFFTSRTPSNQPFEGILEEKIKILALRDSSGVDVTGTDAGSNRVPTVVVFEADELQVSYLLRAQSLGELNIIAISDEHYRERTTIAPIEEEIEPSEKTNDEAIKELLDAISGFVSKEQQSLLDKVKEDYTEGIGQKFAGSEAKLFIDAMTYRIEQSFMESSMLVTPSGEVVYYDKETGQIRYFKSEEEYKGSIYALKEFTVEELEDLEIKGTLTPVQKEQLDRMRNISADLDIRKASNGDYFLVLPNGEAEFYTVDKFIAILEESLEANGRLSLENQLILRELKTKGTNSVQSETTETLEKSEGSS